MKEIFLQDMATYKAYLSIEKTTFGRDRLHNPTPQILVGLSQTVAAAAKALERINSNETIIRMEFNRILDSLEDYKNSMVVNCDTIWHNINLQRLGYDLMFKVFAAIENSKFGGGDVCVFVSNINLKTRKLFRQVHYTPSSKEVEGLGEGAGDYIEIPFDGMNVIQMAFILEVLHHRGVPISLEGYKG